MGKSHRKSRKVAWACDEKIGALHRKKGDENEREKEERNNA